MTREKLLDATFLASLGLDPAAVGPLQVLLAQPDETQQGATGEAVLIGWLLLQALLPVNVQRRLDDPSRFRVFSQREQPVQVIGADRLATDDGDWCAEVRLAEGQVGVIRQPDGRGVLVGHDRTGVYVRAIDPCPDFAEFRSAALEWAGDLPWLADQVRAVLEAGGTWSEVRAAALVHRYSPVAMERDQRKAFLEGIFRGESPNDRPARWMALLGDPELDTIEDYSVAESIRTRRLLDDLSDDPDVDSPGWTEVWTDICLARDDLQGLRALVAAAQAIEVRPRLTALRAVLETVIQALDERGLEACQLLAVPSGLTCERLERYAAGEHEAWWLAAFRETT